MVYQDIRLVPDLTVAQNVWLGHEPAGPFGLVDRRQLNERTAALLRRFNAAIDPGVPAMALSAAQRQIVEIAKALVREPRVLILDEPTSALGPQEVEHLFTILDELKRNGTAIIFISHRLPEVFQIADQITVLKDGRVMGTLPAGAATEAEVVRMMVGRAVDVLYPPRQAPASDDKVLEVRDLVLAGPPAVSHVSFALRRGEIVGLAGIEGNGQREIVRSLFGLIPTDGGEIIVRGRTVRSASPHDAMAAGIVYVTNDRRSEALALPLSVRENLELPLLGALSRLGVMQPHREQAVSDELIVRLAIRPPHPEQPVVQLSGGNQQKVSLGRWLKTGPQVFLFDEPTQGVDVGAKAEIYHIIQGLAHDGAGVIVLSSDLLELIGICHRILVVSGGRIVDEQPAEAATEESLIRAAVMARRQGHAGASSGQRADTGARRRAWFRRWSGPLLVAALFILITLYTSTLSPYVFTAATVSNLALQAIPLGLAALGQSFVILLAGVDLSIGPVMSLVTAIASYLIVADTLGSTLLGAAVALGAGIGVGLLNAVLIRYIRIPDLIATLATYSAVQGIALNVRPSPGGVVSSSFMTDVTAQIGPVPYAALGVLVLYLVGEVLLLRSKWGTYVYAVGSRAEAAYSAGVPIARVRVLAYVASGLCGALAGLVLAAQIGSGDPQSGTTFTLGSITAVVVGGASIFGGRGTLTGTLLGVLLVSAMQNNLDLLHVSSYVQYVWTGLLMLLAMGLSSFKAAGLGRLRRRLVRQPRPASQPEPLRHVDP
jgi:ribose transport system ATP-binding protein